MSSQHAELYAVYQVIQIENPQNTMSIPVSYLWWMEWPFGWSNGKNMNELQGTNKYGGDLWQWPQLKTITEFHVKNHCMIYCTEQALNQTLDSLDKI